MWPTHIHFKSFGVMVHRNTFVGFFKMFTIHFNVLEFGEIRTMIFKIGNAIPPISTRAFSSSQLVKGAGADLEIFIRGGNGVAEGSCWVASWRQIKPRVGGHSTPYGK